MTFEIYFEVMVSIEVEIQKNICLLISITGICSHGRNHVSTFFDADLVAQCVGIVDLQRVVVLFFSTHVSRTGLRDGIDDRLMRNAR